MSISFNLVIVILMLFASCTSLQNWREDRKNQRLQFCCNNFLCLKNCKYGDDFIYVKFIRTLRKGELDSLFTALELSDSSDFELPFKKRFKLGNDKSVYNRSISSIRQFNSRRPYKRVILENTGKEKFRKNSLILNVLRKHELIESAQPVCSFVYTYEGIMPIAVDKVIYFSFKGDTSNLEKLKTFEPSDINITQLKEGYNVEAIFDDLMGYEIIRIAKKVRRIKGVDYVSLNCIPPQIYHQRRFH